MKHRAIAAIGALGASWAVPAAALAREGEGACSGGPGWFLWFLTVAAIVGGALYVKGAVDRNTELLLTIDDDVRGIVTKLARMDGGREAASAPAPEAPKPAPRRAAKAPAKKAKKSS